MPLTSNSDVFASVDEEALNRVIRHIQLQRPSMFNFATADLITWALAQNPVKLCREIEATPDVSFFHNELITPVSPIEVPGTNPPLGLNFCVQFQLAGIDFHPGNVIHLPPPLPPLAANQFAIQAKVCGAVGCPEPSVLNRLALPSQRRRLPSAKDTKNEPLPRPPITVLPFRQLTCFCIDVFVVGSVTFQGAGIDAVVFPSLEALELVDIEPAGLEQSIECLVRVTVGSAILPQLRVPVKTLAFPLTSNVKVAAVPANSINPNPAIRNDACEVFINLQVIP